MTYTTINLNSESHIATISLNRPDVRNAMNEIMIQEITTAFHSVGKDSNIRIVVLNGQGESFCSGADLNMMKNSIEKTSDENKAETVLLAKMYKTIDECNKPIVGIVHGHAFGGGFGLCTVCDIVIAEEKTQFSLSEVLIGLIPAVIGPYTEKKIGKSWFRALGISGERFDAPFAEKIGIIHYCVKNDELEIMTNQVVDQLLKGGPVSQAKFKEYIRDMDSIDSTDVISEIRSSEEGQEGLSAFLEKRKPNWIKN